MRLAGDADLAVKPTDIAIGRRFGILIVVIPVRTHLLFLQKKLIEDIFHIGRAHVFQRVDFRRQAVVGDGLIERLDHFRDAFHSRRGSLDDHRVAPAVGDDVHLL